MKLYWQGYRESNSIDRSFGGFPATSALSQRDYATTWRACQSFCSARPVRDLLLSGPKIKAIIILGVTDYGLGACILFRGSQFDHTPSSSRVVDLIKFHY